ncbi:uncharacterized protein Z518_10436 [Rhinocladiella mackenziei CBS 650.93]|uniref:Nucleolar protein Dnt1-like N-terminal domain-containing protein n=1 Tax=Rhinocladiella mackenziei CBS 650.93 TaxID=1442369 RepID=A0A0D2FDY0_9EURO|nr:uncharacterized protein Z518_10436 [Rhinocladiella mackenziei CBS 650.93]KIX00297.1 hypothetical protein Z518_10436 [Rhinocladiella mackenziei CBS 650.93]
MVRIRVAARIIPEDDYLEHIEKPANLPFKGEKRLVVVVRDPYRWQIGTLALEVQRAYKSCYQHDLPIIKYLKDNEDDCDLDPQLFVSDLLLDEGKAERDGVDQRVTIKVILEQGRAVREGSVAVGSQLSNPQYRIQYQKTSRPPVPTFPGVPSSLGKRPFSSSENRASIVNGGKRPRQIEIPETQREESLIASIERDERAESPGLVQDAQASTTQQSPAWPQSILQPKAESPELWRSLQHVLPATADELEELPGPPPSIGSNRRDRTQPKNCHSSLEPLRLNGGSSSFQEPHLHNLGLSGASITPRSEARDLPASFNNRHAVGLIGARRSPAQSASTSAQKFIRRDVYDFPESDIDDSQMSPRSRQAQQSHGKSKDQLSRIERPPPPDAHNNSEHRLSVEKALEALENESTFEGHGYEPPNARMGEGDLQKDTVGTTEGSENDMFQDAPMDDQTKASIEPSQASESEEDDNTKAALPSAQPKPGISKANRADHLGAETSEKVSDGKDNRTSSMKKEESSRDQPAKKRTRKRPSKSGSCNINGDEVSGQTTTNKRDQAVSVLTKASQKNRDPRRTPSLDSPGEQLSQSLQESARKEWSMKAVNKKLAERQEATTSSPTPGKIHNQDGLTVNADKQTIPPKELRGREKDESVSSPKKAPRQRKSRTDLKSWGTNRQTDAMVSALSLVAHRSEKREAQDSSTTKPLPNWGSDQNGVADRVSSVQPQPQPESFTAGKQGESRKSPSLPMGLTEEEIQIMKSRAGMTKEQYEAEKKRKREEAKKQAAELQRKKAVTAKRESTVKPSTEKDSKGRSATPTDSVSMKEKPREIVSTDDTSKRTGKSTTLKHTSDTPSEKAKSASSSKTPTANKTEPKRRESSTTSSSQPRKSDASLPLKTPAKMPTKSPSAKSSTTHKSAKPSGQQQSESKAPSTTSKISTPAPSSSQTKPSAPYAPKSASTSMTSRTPQRQGNVALSKAKSLSELRGIMRKEEESSTKAPAVEIKANQKRSLLNLSSDDDGEETESSDDDDDDDGKEAAAAEKKAKQESSSSSSSSTDDEDEDEDESEEEDETDDAKTKAKPRAKPRPLGQPDPSIRDRIVEPGSDDDEDDDL